MRRRPGLPHPGREFLNWNGVRECRAVQNELRGIFSVYIALVIPGKELNCVIAIAPALDESAVIENRTACLRNSNLPLTAGQRPVTIWTNHSDMAGIKCNGRIAVICSRLSFLVCICHGNETPVPKPIGEAGKHFFTHSGRPIGRSCRKRSIASFHCKVRIMIA